MKLPIYIVFIAAWVAGLFADANSEARLVEIRATLQSIETQLDAENLPPSDPLVSALATLSGIIEKPAVSGRVRHIALYHRAMAHYLVNRVREKKREALDSAAARSALSDYDLVISSGLDLSDWNITRAEAIYRAGIVAYNDLGSEQLGYSYWKRCAEESHLGCANIMANAYLAGTGGQTVDIQRAVDLHVLVFISGSAYGCAGAYSAESLALIAHFMGVKGHGDDASVWLTRGQDLAEAVAASGSSWGNGNPCGFEGFDMVEYLMRLENGEAMPSLLARAAGRSNLGKASGTIIQYLRGEIDDAVFKQKLPGFTDYERCDLQFYAAWLAMIQKRSDAAREYREAIGALDVCAPEAAYLKKYKL
jgi:hypothetical protein